MKMGGSPMITLILDAHASGPKDGEHHGSREQGSCRKVSHPSGQRAHSVHFKRPQGEKKSSLNLNGHEVKCRTEEVPNSFQNIFDRMNFHFVSHYSSIRHCHGY